jgi:hypothetical protein
MPLPMVPGLGTSDVVLLVDLVAVLMGALVVDMTEQAYALRH